MPPKTGRNCPDFGPIFPGITRERHRTPGNNKEGASIKIVLKNGKIWRAALRHAKTNICPTFDKKRQFATKSGPPQGLSNPAGQDAPPPPTGTAAPPGLSPGRFPARCRHSPAGGCYQPGHPKRPPPPGHREKRPPPAGIASTICKFPGNYYLCNSETARPPSAAGPKSPQKAPKFYKAETNPETMPDLWPFPASTRKPVFN